MRLLVIRHGETENNVLHLVQGVTDSPLTENGIAETKLLRLKLKEEKIDYVIASPLGRTRATAKNLIRDDLPINIDDRLIERNWGIREKAKLEEVDRVVCWNYYANSKEGAIEPVQDFVKRIQEFLWETRLKHQDETVLLITHSAVARAIYYIVNGIPDDGDMTKIKIPNLEIMDTI